MPHWPVPTPGETTIYVLGPGFGESVVLVLPDASVAVVDCCVCGDRCLTLDLVQELGGTIALLVVTHPDLDHVAGLDRLLAAVKVERAWLYPHLSLVRTFLGKWGRPGPSTNLLEEAWSALDSLRDRNAAVTVAYGHMDWSRAGLTLSVLAPLEADILKAEGGLRRLVDHRGRLPRLSEATVKKLLGDARVGDHPNLVSLALAGDKGGWKFLLGGDLEAPKSGNRGWSGVLHVLARDERTALLENLDLVKVSHHGSTGAWSSLAWRLHTGGCTRKVPFTIVTPFNRGSVSLPHIKVLKDLRKVADTLAVPSGVVDVRLSSAEWSARSRCQGNDMVVLRLDSSGRASISAHGAAGIFD